jgi:hypothetical protein
VLAADLLAAAGDGEVVGFLGRHIKQGGQVVHAAEVGALFVNAAAGRTGVVVDAPAIGAHHGDVLLLLFGAQGVEGFIALAGIEPAAGAAAADAAPVRGFAHAKRCDNPSQQLAASPLIGAYRP